MAQKEYYNKMIDNMHNKLYERPVEDNKLKEKIETIFPYN